MKPSVGWAKLPGTGMMIAKKLRNFAHASTPPQPGGQNCATPRSHDRSAGQFYPPYGLPGDHHL
jgi:hypothetical protein